MIDVRSGRPVAALDAPLGTFFLARLARLLSLADLAELTAQQRALARRAVFSTYLDCIDAGPRTEADARVEIRRRVAADAV